MAAPVGATVTINLRTLALVVAYLSLTICGALVLYGFPWAVFGVAISGYTLGLLSGVTWFLDPWMASLRRRHPR
jgi:hypothetical protein